jgi:tRNA-splicing ligase RtcB
MPIGGVLATKGVIIPNAVGVDIGCGMHAVKTKATGNPGSEWLKKAMGLIREVIPLGFNHHKEKQDEKWMPFHPYHDNVCQIVAAEYQSAMHQVGTLGGGNHFIEIQMGSDGHVWFMIHSGSRNLGKKVCDFYNAEAKKINERWFSSVPSDWQLSFFPIDSEEGQAYLAEMDYCLRFARNSRQLMAENILRCTGFEAEEEYDVHHNYATMENHFGANVMVHRKGATSAKEGQIGIIPGSQGTRSYIVKGKGNSDSFQSCSHGAGRLMSRAEARKSLNLQGEIKKMDDQGIIHGIRSANDLDEATGAYKDISQVMAAQSDLVDIVVELTPLAVIKG